MLLSINVSLALQTHIHTHTNTHTHTHRHTHTKACAHTISFNKNRFCIYKFCSPERWYETWNGNL